MFLGNPALHVSLARSVLHMLVYLSVSSPSSLSVEPDADADPETDAVPVIGSPSDDLAFATEQPGKQPPPLIIPISPMSILSYSCIRIAATATAPITVA